MKTTSNNTHVEIIENYEVVVNNFEIQDIVEIISKHIAQYITL